MASANPIGEGVYSTWEEEMRRRVIPGRAAPASGEEAQSVIEFAIILTILMLLFLGTVDFARFLYYDTAIRNAARVGAEAAVNQCTNETNCGTYNGTALNDGILQSTRCEAANDGRVSLQPQISCSACISTLTGCSSTWDPCSTAGCGISNSCGKDICIKRYKSSSCSGNGPCSGTDPCSAGTRSTTTTSSSGQCITVIVGYNFQPIAPLLNQFFQTQPCWSGDTTTHTLCASATGRVY